MKKKLKRKRDIRVGVIGYGGAYNMGRHHLNEMKAAGMTPVAVCDTDGERLALAQHDFDGIETYRSAGRMLAKSDVDLVTVITPHNTHARLALKCLEAGRHVVCEKPFAITVDQCNALIAAARKRRLMVSTYHNRHWDGCVVEAVDQVLTRKVIGDVVSAEIRFGHFGLPGPTWRSSRSISGGLAYDWGVHLLEYALQILDDEMLEVCGFAKTGVWASKSPWIEDVNEDAVFAVVRFARQKWLTLSMSQLEANPKKGFLEVRGTQGSYIMDHGTYEIVQPRSRGRVVRTEGVNRQDAWHEYYENVANHLARGTPLAIPPEWARRPIQILDMANRSAKTGRAIRLKYR